MPVQPAADQLIPQFRAVAAGPFRARRRQRLASAVASSHLRKLPEGATPLTVHAGTAARLLPLSVDGLILAASLVLLHEARNDRDAPGLARLMLWLGNGHMPAAKEA